MLYKRNDDIQVIYKNVVISENGMKIRWTKMFFQQCLYVYENGRYLLII